jgi:hypothetical protein
MSAQSAWEEFLAGERVFIDEKVAMIQVPSREQLVKDLWADSREYWASHERNGGLEVQYSPCGDTVLYQQIRYGDVWVIEAEGVIVERLDVIPA